MSSPADDALRYDVVVDPALETSHGKLVRYTGHNKSVLDLGCSTGGVARALAEWGCTVWGVEIDPAAAKVAEETCKRVVVGDLDTVDLEQEFADLRFDVILAGDVLEHLKDPQRVLEQSRRLLAEGGYVVLSVPNMAHGSVRLALLHGELPPSETGLLDRTHIQYLTRTLVTELITRSGFTVAYLDGTIAPIEGSEVPFPDDDLTAAVLGQLEADPDAAIYQYVAIAYPGPLDDQPPLVAITRGLSEDLRLSRANATAWESRCVAAEAQLAEVQASIDARVAAGLAQMRQELLVARDQLMHRDHDVKRVVALYEQHTAALQHSEEDRIRLHADVLRVSGEAAATAEQLAAAEHAARELRASASWRIGQTVVGLMHGKLPKVRR